MREAPDRLDPVVVAAGGSGALRDASGGADLDGGGGPGPAGFTLLELMIVTVILGILAAIAVPIYQSFRERAAISALQSELRTLNNAQELYFVEREAYTDDLDRLQYEPGEDVQVELRVPGGGGAGWAGRLTDEDFGVRCAYYTGSVTPYDPATAEGSVACDRGG